MNKRLVAAIAAVGALSVGGVVYALSDDGGQSRQAAINSTAYKADMQIAVSVSSAAVKLGAYYSYSLTARNNGPSAAYDVKIVTTLPVGFTPTQTTPGSTGGAACTRANVTVNGGSTTKVTCSYPAALGPGQSYHATMIGKAPPTSSTGTLVNVATVKSATSKYLGNSTTITISDPNSANNSLTTTTPVS